MLVNRGSFNGVTLVGRDYVELMERGYIDVPSKVFGDERYGYGLIVTEKFLGDKKLVYHSGSVLVYTAFIGYLPSERVGVALLANGQGYPLSNMGFYILSLLVGEEPEKLEFIRRDRILSELTGRYETYMGTHYYVIERKGDFLVARYNDRFVSQEYILVPLEVKEDYVRLYTLANGRYMEAIFTREGGDIVLYFERYRLVKRSS